MELSDEENEVGRETRNSGDEGGYRSDEAQEDPGDNEGGEGESGKGRRIDPATSKKKVVRNPQPKLNAERIQGKKGVQTIEKYFEGFKFYGKGHEKADLDRVMKRLEHWAHRLFPKYRFDDFLEKMETLGGKKNVQVFLTKYRHDMITADDDIIDQDNENRETQEEQSALEEAPVDEFDKLIAEQIEKQRQVTIEPPIQIHKDAGHVLGSASTAKPSELSEEVKARMEANRKLAIERKMARLKREEENKKRKLEETQVNAQISVSEVSSTTNSLWSEEENKKKKLEESQVEIEVSNPGVSSSKESFLGQEKVEEKRPKGLKIVEDVILIAEETTTDYFGGRGSRKIAEEETKKRKTLGFFEEEIPVTENEEEIKKIGEPVVKESLSEDLPFSAVANDVAAENILGASTYQFKRNYSPEVKEESKNESEKLLTHEELLMEIDGAMEEIINKSSRRSA